MASWAGVTRLVAAMILERWGMIDLGTGRTSVAIDAGTNFICALLDNGAVKCWGDNGFGELGQGDTNDRGDLPGEMGDNLPASDLGTQ
ncbi:MAG: RCC1 domain-containing protein [Desulfobacterales bacterium]